MEFSALQTTYYIKKKHSLPQIWSIYLKNEIENALFDLYQQHCALTTTIDERGLNLIHVLRIGAAAKKLTLW